MQHRIFFSLDSVNKLHKGQFVYSFDTKLFFRANTWLRGEGNPEWYPIDTGRILDLYLVTKEDLLLVTNDSDEDLTLFRLKYAC